MILDTQYLGELANGNQDARRLAEELDDRAAPVRIPAGVVWEVMYGLGRTDRTLAGTRRIYETLFESSTVIPFDDHAARRAGTLRGKHSGSDDRRTLDGADSMVAAHGLLLNEAVVSNDSDLQDVEGLDVVTY
ncbi:PIN domain-containing protein [Halobaculum sp. CBA1158]|uniref:PIN domain-containing protein n=1 Tax=Halobaculum sp. CBA1158 TaxID=2904243 RepID=UPI001F41FC5E|nr:PIN domain-containing protein [Halobaculum sp. CBA1158]UIP00275.1 PIN domain-containing protein [Halobaculum sp. CBA1158]